jgi:hypothetical protein
LWGEFTIDRFLGAFDEYKKRKAAA